MLASRLIPLFSLLLCLTSAIASAQEVREWTDASGQKLTGKFIELTSDNVVRIESNGEEYGIPLSAFIQADQDYAKLQQANANKPKTPTDSSPAPWIDKSDKTLFENREWANYRDQKIKARYVRMVDGYVVLMQGANPQKVSFYLLSKEDQDYLRNHLKKRGELDQILTRQEIEEDDPDVHKDMDSYISSGPTGMDGGPMTSNTNGNNNTSRPPAYVPPETEPYRPPSDELPSGNGSANGSPMTTEPTNMFGTEPLGPDSGTAPMANGTSDPNTENGNTSGTSSGSPGFADRFRSKGGDSSVPPGHCPNCRMELPAGYGAGDHCPRCKVFLEEWVVEGSGPPVDPWYVRYPVIYIVGFGVVIIGGLTMLSKKFYG
ncbi:hypothetical protein AB1L30_25525 [Bremerella sp. JC817]|uniref:hypothetical protein n=1 Tax=Bremerella sp. JC817 TaxID=3231756 RepID=UPI003457FC98